MKSFERFKKDLSEMDRSIAGPGLVGAGLRGMLNVASGPVRKGVKAVTSFASAVDDFSKRRKAEKEYKDAINKGIQNTRDSEADKRVADSKKDPDLEKLDRRPPDGSTPKDTSPEFQDTMRGLGRGKNLDKETKLERIRKATDDFKNWQKSNKPKK